MADVKVEDSILLSVKKSLGLDPSMTHFDPDIIICINSVLNVLTQLGVGSSKGFIISSEDSTWDELIGEDQRLNMVKTYVFLKVKIIFDPPTTGAVLESCKELIKEYEWRLNVQVDPENTFDEEVSP